MIKQDIWIDQKVQMLQRLPKTQLTNKTISDLMKDNDVKKQKIT